jgi:aminoglycoside phosphotransferase (APT) family kinase protein
MRDGWSEAEALARARLRGSAATASLADGRFEPIDHGLANHAWRVTSPAGTKRFVRLASAAAAQVGADLRAEASALRQVAAAGLAPGVVHCDPAARLLVTEWVEGVGGDDAGLGRGVVITLVAQALHRLHTLMPVAGGRYVSFARQAQQLQAGLPPSAVAPELMAVARGVFASLEATVPPRVLCHHDVHARNLVIDAARRLWLVDWEYAGLGDPAFDLASFASQYCLTPEESLGLHAVYAGAGGDVPWRRLEMAGWAFDYVQWLWYQAVAARTGSSDRPSTACERAVALRESLSARASAVLRCNNV